MYPKIVELNAELGDAVEIVKLNCNATNKVLAKGLGVRVAPTFFLFKGGEKVDMVGQLRAAEMAA